ncbi:NTP transferase domain-containing protein [Colwelliaceae bacterium BS250]
MSENVALVLAAGFSHRYGSDKRFSGKDSPLILQTLTKVLCHFDTVYLVHRFDDDDLINLLAGYNVTLIAAPDNEIGLGISIAAGSKHIANINDKTNDKTAKHPINSITIFLADMPFIGDDTIAKILKQADPDTIIRPLYNNKPGHPVCFGSSFIAALVELTGDNGAAAIIKANSNNIKYVEVSDIGIINDIDIPSNWP